MLLTFTLCVVWSVLLVVVIFFTVLHSFVKFSEGMRLVLSYISLTGFNISPFTANWCYGTSSAVRRPTLCSRANPCSKFLSQTTVADHTVCAVNRYSNTEYTSVR